jgi:mycothiol synthase
MIDASVRGFQPGDEPAILTVAEAALEVDRWPGVDRQVIVRMVDRLVGDPGGTAVALEGEQIVGYCAPRFDDLTVHPGFRRRGHGRRLIAAAVDIVRSRGLNELVLFGSTDTPAGAGFIAAMGARYVHSDWRFDLAPEVAVPAAAFPADVALRTYDHPADLYAYAALAAESFADHPTPIPFTTELISRSHSLPDFDPGGILLVAPVSDPARPVAWTKVRRFATDAGEPQGSVDFVGVVPTWRRRGLGRELLHWGIARLRANGARTIELNVTATNEKALDLYRSTGFEPAIEWPHYAVSVR